MSFSAMALSSVDFPEPFLPMSAYLWPALSRSLALARSSVPSVDLLAFALLLPPADLLARGVEVTVMFRPSMSSCRRKS